MQEWPCGEEELLNVALSENTIVHSGDCQGDANLCEMERIIVGQKASMLCAPLNVNDELYGAILIWRNSENAFDEMDKNLLLLFCESIGKQISNGDS